MERKAISVAMMAMPSIKKCHGHLCKHPWKEEVYSHPYQPTQKYKERRHMLDGHASTTVIESMTVGVTLSPTAPLPMLVPWICSLATLKSIEDSGVLSIKTTLPIIQPDVLTSCPLSRRGIHQASLDGHPTRMHPSVKLASLENATHGSISGSTLAKLSWQGRHQSL